MHKTSKVLFLLERILGPQDDEELQSTLVSVLAALDKGGKEAGVSYLNETLGSVDPDAGVTSSDLWDAAFECKAELAELLEQGVPNHEQDQNAQHAQGGRLSATLCSEIRQYFSTFLTADTLPDRKLSLPAPVPMEPSNGDDCATPISATAEPTVTAYANRTEYSLCWEAQHTDESVAIVSVLHRLQMDPAFARVYSPVTTFNSVQMRVVDPIFNGGNTLVAAPTGAGKTNIALWAMICLLHASRSQHKPVQLVIYVAPLKALVHEVLLRLESSLQRLPEDYTAAICEYTGEESISLSAISSLLHGPRTATTLVILVATPEKLDIFTSKLVGKDFQLIRSSLALVVIDELHLIGDHTRGNVIEELVLRFHRHYHEAMLLALSATVPNAQQMARFLRCSASNTLVFDSSYRAVSLRVTICELYYKHTEETHLRNIREGFLHDIVPKQLSKGGILLFTHTRCDAERLAMHFHATLDNASYSKTYAERARNKKLHSLLSTNSSVLFHHAGLARTDRRLVEELFTEKKISILVSTATLAWGVNMPAHTVVVLGTKVYANSRWEALSFADILQMAGRAGRPSFDSYGECFIIPSPNDASRCLAIFKNGFRIESSFLSSHVAIEKLAKLVIAEAFLSAHIFATEIAQIITSSLFAVQLHERLPDPEDDPQFITDLAVVLLDCCCDIGLLEKKTDETDPHLIQYHPTFLAQLCVKYYVSPFTAVRSHAILSQSLIDSLQQALLLVALSHEYTFIFTRSDEGFELASLEEYAPIKYPQFVTRQELGKICLLLQVHISTGPCYGTTSAAFGSLSLMSDYANIVASAPRIAGCLRELAWFLKQGESHQHLNRLYCMLQSRCWPTVLFAREVLGSPLFKLGSLSSYHIQWIEQLELRQHSPDTLRRLTLDQLSQLVHSPDAKGPPDKRQLSHLLTVLTGYPTIKSRIVRACQLGFEHYEVQLQCCLVGSQAILHCPEQAFSLHCVIEAGEKTLKAVSIPVYLNEELDIVLQFKAAAEVWTCHAHLYLEDALFATSSARIDLVGAGPNKNVLTKASITECDVNEKSLILTHIENAIATLRHAPGANSEPNSILIAGDCLYLQQAEMLSSILSFIRDTSASHKLNTLVIGSIGGLSRQIAKRSGLLYMDTSTAYKKTGELFTKPVIIIIPSIAELAEPAGYVLELLLMRLVKRSPGLSVLIIVFSINLINHSIAALSLFLKSKTFIINWPSILIAQDAPLHVHTVSSSGLCDDPDSMQDVYEALYISDDDPDLSILTPFFLCQLLMMCRTTGKIYIAVHAAQEIHPQCLRSQLHTADGLFMLVSEHSQDLYSKGFDYIAEHIITTDIPQSYLYSSFSVLPGQYVDHRTMVNYHPKPEEEDFLREEDAMLDAFSDWISAGLIAVEEGATALLRVWQKEDRGMPWCCSCLSSVAAQVCANSNMGGKQPAESSWFAAFFHSIHSLSILSLCASRVYSDELADYIQYEKALSLQRDSEVDRVILRSLADMTEGCPESREYALLVALTSLVLRVHEGGDKTVLNNGVLLERLGKLLQYELPTDLFTME